jgi:hypothetical protein
MPAAWTSAYHPDAPTAVLRLKTDLTLWRARRWTDLGDRAATLLDVGDQLPAVFEALAPGLRLAFRFADPSARTAAVVAAPPVAVGLSAGPPLGR